MTDLYIKQPQWPVPENSRHADLDGDVIAYQCAFACDKENIQGVQRTVDGFVKGVIQDADCSSWTVHLTGQNNFRKEVATIQPYKGNRSDKEKPRYLPLVRDYLKEYWGAIEHDEMEADDGMSISHYFATAPDTSRYDDLSMEWSPPRDKVHVICTIDKDLNGVLGANLFNWDKQTQEFMTPDDASQFFYTQLLTGDATDHIKGLSLSRDESKLLQQRSVGPKSKWVAELEHMGTPQEMYEWVLEAYQLRCEDLLHVSGLTRPLKNFLNLGPEAALIENARLLFMLEYPGQLWEPPK